VSFRFVLFVLFFSFLLDSLHLFLKFSFRFITSSDCYLYMFGFLLLLLLLYFFRFIPSSLVDS
jgi:hypothetical protein